MPTTTGPSASTLPQDGVDLLIHANHWNPFEVLGPHPVDLGGSGNGAGRAVSVRAFLPDAARAWVVDLARGEPGTLVEMNRVHPDGVFEALFNGRSEKFPYRLQVENFEGHTWQFVDPYMFGPVLTDFDLHLLGEGTHYRNFERLGAHLRVHEGFRGVHFAVWAPNAMRVSVVGNFNHWDGRRHTMRSTGATGIWELFIPDLSEGEVYKLEIKSRFNSYLVQKSDPYGFASEMRPKTASIVWDVNKYQWEDGEWMASRDRRQALDAPISVYEVHLGSWKRKVEEGDRFLTYRELADGLVEHLRGTNFTHIELLPVSEHPFDGSWGYQPVGYFAPTSRHGTPDDFAYFVDTLHQNGIGVILDWVPAHFPRPARAGLFRRHPPVRARGPPPRRTPRLGHQDLQLRSPRSGTSSSVTPSSGSRSTTSTGCASTRWPRCSTSTTRASTTSGSRTSTAGTRTLEAIDFIKRLNELCHREHPGVLTIAEESTSWSGVSRPTYLGGLGFSLKWNMGWMNDTLDYISKDPVFRKYEHGSLTFSLIYAFHENFMLPLSHDEVVHGKRSLLDKMPGDLWQKFANLRALRLPLRSPGQEAPVHGERDRPVARVVARPEPRLAPLAVAAPPGGLPVRERPELALPVGTGAAPGRLRVAGVRVAGASRLGEQRRRLPATRGSMRTPPWSSATSPLSSARDTGRRAGRGFLPRDFNTDAEYYGGSNVGNEGGVWPRHEPYAGRPYQISLKLPPLGVLYLKVPSVS
ncbi:MAG: alpha amylase C-terminal domain-containing protein [Isosphaeraceae bacterium]